MDIELFKELSKYPFIHGNILYDSTELVQNKTCREKCKDKDCLQMLNDKTHLQEYICSKGFNTLLIAMKDFKVLLNGLILENNSSIPTGRREARINWVISRESILLFIKKLEEIETYLSKKVNETTEKNFSMFHDFKTSMGIFFSCTEAIIAKSQGSTFLEKLESSDKEVKDLYNALELITSQLGMIDVIINPKSITFGEKKLINIYKLFHKISILFRHISDKKHVSIELKNIDRAIINSSYCFETIEFIPLILLDNAIKYSEDYTTIEIEISQLYHKARIRVKNIGPLVDDKNVEKIFEKFFRDDSAQSFSKEGIGMGLWIAQQILAAHDSKLTYFKMKNSYGHLGLNSFEFDLPTIG